VSNRSIFVAKAISAARANIISIRSPAEFQRSIKILHAGRYTRADQQALILARSRAKAQLSRKDLSVKEQIQMRAISETKIPSYISKNKFL
jgi:hypothetical protein